MEVEIKEAVLNLSADKAPSLDEFSIFFLKVFW